MSSAVETSCRGWSVFSSGAKFLHSLRSVEMTKEAQGTSVEMTRGENESQATIEFQPSSINR
jgi:hypothetical protein